MELPKLTKKQWTIIVLIIIVGAIIINYLR